MVFTFGYSLDMEVEDLLNKYFFDESILKTIDKSYTTIQNIFDVGIKNSNIYQSAKLYKQQEQKIVWRDSEYFTNYLTVQPNERFDIWRTYIAAIRDVHPPLYFIILNIISSFIPNIFSVWGAFLINYVAMLSVCVLLYYLMQKYYSGCQGGIMVVGLYGFSGGYISTMYLYRPYALLTLFVLIFYICHLNFYTNNWTMDRRHRLMLIVVTVLGYLTQYYFVFIAIGVAILTVVVMFRYKQTNQLKRYVLSFVYAAIIGLITWPFSIKHIFFGARGTEAIDTIGNIGKLHQLWEFANIVISDIYSRSWAFAIGLLCFAIIMIVINRKKSPLYLNYKVMLLIVPTIFYFIIASLISPYETSRYIMCIFPLISIINTVVLMKGIQMLAKSRYQIICTMTIIIITRLLSIGVRPVDFYQITQSDKENLIDVQERKEKCVFVYNKRNQYDSSVPDFMNYDKTLLVQGDNLALLRNDKTVQNARGLVIYVAGYDEGKIDEICSIMGYNNYELIARKSVAKVYYVSKE